MNSYSDNSVSYKFFILSPRLFWPAGCALQGQIKLIWGILNMENNCSWEGDEHLIVEQFQLKISLLTTSLCCIDFMVLA